MNYISLNKKADLRCYAKPPTVKDVFWSVLGAHQLRRLGLHACIQEFILASSLPGIHLLIYILLPLRSLSSSPYNYLQLRSTNILLATCSFHSFYAVVVVRGETPSANQAVYNDAGPYTPDASYYIAAAWAGENISSVPDSYTVGDGSTTVANTMVYRNAELSSSTRYGIFVRIDIESDAGNMVGYFDIGII